MLHKPAHGVQLVMRAIAMGLGSRCHHPVKYGTEVTRSEWPSSWLR